MRRTLTLLSMMLGLLLALSATAAVAAPPDNANENAADHFREGAVYADGQLFDTLILTDAIEVHDGNRHSFDLLYRIEGQQSVGEAAPGQGYNGGRWIPVPTTWLVAEDERPLLTSAADVLAAEAAGLLTIADPNEDGAFVCPLIRSR
jgi:hypothetical protein